MTRGQPDLPDSQEIKDIKVVKELKAIVGDVGAVNQFRWTLQDSFMVNLSVTEIMDHLAVVVSAPALLGVVVPQDPQGPWSQRIPWIPWALRT